MPPNRPFSPLSLSVFRLPTRIASGLGVAPRCVFDVISCDHAGDLALVLSKQVTYAIASPEEAARGCARSFLCSTD